MLKKKNNKRKNSAECHFCNTSTVPNYKDTLVLRRFISDRGKIVSSKRAGICSKHQKALSTQIKRARFMALLPYTDKHSI